MQYLLSRRISLAAISIYGLGYFDHNHASVFYDRLMVPIRDPYGNLISFQGRALFDYDALGLPKYFHAPYDKSAIVYGLHECGKRAIDASCITVVEGPFDVIACYDATLCAVATLD